MDKAKFLSVCLERRLKSRFQRPEGDLVLGGEISPASHSQVWNGP